MNTLTIDFRWDQSDLYDPEDLTMTLDDFQVSPEKIGTKNKCLFCQTGTLFEGRPSKETFEK